MKTLLTIALLAIALSTHAASPFLPGFSATNGPISQGSTVTLDINPEATAALLAFDSVTARHGVPERGAIAPPPPAAETPAPAGRFYTDQFLSLRTTDFSHDETFGYGAAVGYQFTPVFAADVRVEHEGLNITGQAIRTVGGRVSARLPIQFLAPSVFCGAAFDLGPDEWRLQPGIAAEIGMSKILRGMSLIVEGGLDANLRGQSGFLFTSGLRWRF